MAAMAITPGIKNESHAGRLALAEAGFETKVFAGLFFPGGFFTYGLEILPTKYTLMIKVQADVQIKNTPCFLTILAGAIRIFVPTAER